MRSKFNEIFETTLTENYDLICLSETWLNDEFLNSDLFDDRYEVFRKDRDFQQTGLSRGGGVLIAAKKYLKAKLVSHFYYAGESIWIKLCLNNCISLYICCIYFPPSSSIDLFQEFYDVVDEHLSNINNIIIVGDFNLPSFNWQDCTSTDNSLLVHDFICFLHLHKFNQFNTIVNFMNRILDLLLVKLDRYNVSVTQPLIPISSEDNYHPALLITLNRSAKILNCKYESFDPIMHSYNFKKANFNLLYTLLILVDWNFLNQYHCINMALEQFYNVLYDIFDVCVPKNITYKRKYPIWFNKTIINNIKLKNFHLRKFKKFNRLHDLECFKSIRQNIKSDIRTARKNYTDFLERSLKLNPKTFWSYYRN